MSRRSVGQLRAAPEPDYGPGESFDGNPFGKPGQDFRAFHAAAKEAEDRERQERLRASQAVPEPPVVFEPPPATEACTVCVIQ